MTKKRSGVYHSLVIIPDELFPFKTLVKGQWVRGIRSYDARLEEYEKQFGMGHYGYKLGAYRQFFHLVGSLLFLAFAAFLSQAFLQNEQAMYVFLGTAILLISFQEFYLHRRLYEQLWKKGILDWMVWCIPFGLYFLTHFR